MTHNLHEFVPAFILYLNVKNAPNLGRNYYVIIITVVTTNPESYSITYADSLT